jgi:protein gp37
MQKSWTQFTSNPIRGKCGHFGTAMCGDFCYAERIRQRFKQPAEMSFHPDELLAIQKRKKPATIFMGSMYDIFGDWVPTELIDHILVTARSCPQHTFLFLTKNFSRYEDFNFPKNCYAGMSVTDQASYELAWTAMADTAAGTKVFLSLEPLLAPINVYDSALHFDAYIIGAQTGPGAIKPEKKWILDIINQVGDTPIFIKDNLLQLYPDLPRRRETLWGRGK